ncbi:hypothetical protein K432DRAFT_141279 [Lepidopterella palustris CBS 459.81]|uniref:Uncharacterized protein n=1 Tax=Lepidopterella palustris CBS 459.81 TaxID=1314670 RepID=A0A8E2E3E9_9PEZI|nr:hypothetical protein K432DRAFT_141279 [Lepidopterella palustris CBS 459.81]
MHRASSAQIRPLSRPKNPTITNRDSKRFLTPQPAHALSHLQQTHHLQQQQTSIPVMGPVQVTPQGLHAIRRKLRSQQRNVSDEQLRDPIIQQTLMKQQQMLTQQNQKNETDSESSTNAPGQMDPLQTDLIQQGIQMTPDQTANARRVAAVKAKVRVERVGMPQAIKSHSRE